MSLTTKIPSGEILHPRPPPPPAPLAVSSPTPPPSPNEAVMIGINLIYKAALKF